MFEVKDRRTAVRTLSPFMFVALLATCAGLTTANASYETSPDGFGLNRDYLRLADTTVCLVPPAPDHPCVPRLNLNPPSPRKRAKAPTHADVPVDAQSAETTQRFGSENNPILVFPEPLLSVSSPDQTNIHPDPNGTNDPLRKINIPLPAPKNPLSRGERGSLKVPVEGLQGKLSH